MSLMAFYCSTLALLASLVKVKSVVVISLFNVLLQERGILHEDIKAENVMLRSENAMDLVLVDFGAAVILDGPDFLVPAVSYMVLIRLRMGSLSINEDKMFCL